MSGDSGFPTIEELEKMNSDQEEEVEPQEIQLEVEEISDNERPEAAEPLNQDEIFVKEEVEEVKPKKKKKVLTQKQLDALAKAREKGLAKRRALKLAKDKEQAILKLEKTAHIRKRKQKKLEQDALIMAHAEEEVEMKEKAEWDEEKLIKLMTRTMDTYYDTRQKKKAERQNIPAPPQGYYVPAQPPPAQRYIPVQEVKPKKPKNPYYKMFGLDDSD